MATATPGDALARARARLPPDDKENAAPAASAACAVTPAGAGGAGAAPRWSQTSSAGCDSAVRYRMLPGPEARPLLALRLHPRAHAHALARCARG